MADLVKYHNQVNKIPLRNFNEKELNLFFSILYKVKDKGSNKIAIDFIDLKKIALTGREDKRLINSLKKMNNKLLDLRQEITLDNGNILMFNLFNTFLFDLENKEIKIEINENFSYMINNLGKGNFTLLELKQLVELRSSYSKNAFRLMKQWESIKKLDIKLDEFKRILCIPKSYRMRDIDKQILTPIMEELSPIFNNLKLEKVKKGRSIDKLIFTWSIKGLPKNGKSLPLGDTKVLEISEGLNKAIEKAKKNRFIKPLISEGNIEKLLDNFTDQELTKGLHFASSEIKTEIKSLNYLIKTINTGIEEKDIKIVVRESVTKDLQGIMLGNEVNEELTEEIREPIKIIDKDLEFFREGVLKELENQKKAKNKNLKHGQYSVAKVLIAKAQSYEQINDLILKYDLNTVES